MQLPFGHKEGGSTGAVPVDEVKALRAQGKADRDVIVELKKKGYSFEIIEKAMLQVLKGGVNSPGTAQGAPGAAGSTGGYGAPQQGASPRPPFSPQQGAFGTQPPGMVQRPQAGFASGPPQAYSPGLPQRENIIPPMSLSAAGGGVLPLEAEVGNPTDIIEEVVEGVVDEKFEKADQKFESMTKELNKGREDYEALKTLMLSSLQKRDKDIEDLRQNIKSMKEEIEDLLVKSAALEKAFKQFLPDITEKVRMQNTEKRIETTTL